MNWTLARRTKRLNLSTIREILKITERPGIISLAGGLPSADTFPVQAMRDATAAVLREHPRRALQYAPSEGFEPLREWVAAELPRHIDVTALLPRAVAAGMACVPGNTFYPHGGHAHTLRLSFVTVAPEPISRGVAALATVLKSA